MNRKLQRETDPGRGTRQERRRRKGAIIVLSAFLMIFIMAVLALSVDVGYMQNTCVELDRAVDAGALAGAARLPEGIAEASAEAISFVKQNHVGNLELTDAEISIEPGTWDKTSRSFTPDSYLPSAMRVKAQLLTRRPLFFARALGRDNFTAASEAIAMYQPRDIMLVLDYSGSMNDDSELRNISALGREFIESNLLQIYGELGSPKYGTLEFAPDWFSVQGSAPANEYQPQIVVQYRYNEVYVTSTKPFDRIRIYSGSSYRNFYGTGTWNAALQVYENTVDYGSYQVTKVEARSGYKDSRTESWNMYVGTFLFDSSTTIRAHARNWFGLGGVACPYPYPRGSWDEWLDYCRASSGYNKNAGYRYKFGYMNLVNYWLEKRAAYSDTPDLWRTSEQPITAVKNAVTVFLSFLQEVETNDQLGLAVYNSPDQQGKLERELGQEFNQIETISRERQAGHYDAYTNIGGGLKTAWEEMERNARPGSFKLIVLMTDGIANRPSSDPIGYVMEQVKRCQDSGYPVVTISLGAGADTDLMQQIADMTGGFHFNVPGGQTVAEYEEDLKDAFREIADMRPLQLVH